MSVCKGKTVYCDSGDEICKSYDMGDEHECFSTLFDTDCINNPDGGGICEDDTGITYYNSDSSSQCANDCFQTVGDDLWLNCTLKFPGTYPPGGDGPGGGGEGGPPPDDDDGIPCDKTHKYWVCVEKRGESKDNKYWTNYTCEQLYTFNVTGENSTDCEPPDELQTPWGQTAYFDKDECEKLCDAGTAHGGGGGAGGGLDDDFNSGCKGIAWKCNSNTGYCTSSEMGKGHPCFQTLFKLNCSPRPFPVGGGCTLDGTYKWYNNKTVCDTWCDKDGGGGDCSGDALRCNTDDKYDPSCQSYSMNIGEPCFQPLFKPNNCKPKEGAGVCIQDGIKYFNKHSTSTNCGDPGACEPACKGKTVYCDPADTDDPTCKPYDMVPEDFCFIRLFNEDCTNKPAGGNECTDPDGKKYYNSDGSSLCAGYCAPLATCTRWTCDNEGFPQQCYADGTEGGLIDYSGSGFCITSSLVNCAPNGTYEYDTCCACGGTYPSDPDLGQYATAMEALLDGKCVTCGACGYGCPHSTPGATDCTKNCWDQQQNKLCHPDNKDLVYDATIKDAKCVFDKNNWPTCWENYLGCTDPNTGCGSDEIFTDYVICAETVCPALTWLPHSNHVNCGVAAPAFNICAQGTYGQGDYSNDPGVFSCTDSALVTKTTCFEAYDIANPKGSIKDLYYDTDFPFEGPPEMGIYQCDNRITDPLNQLGCIWVKANKCPNDENTPCGQGSGKGFGDNCWECSPSTDACCSQTARGKRSNGGTLICPKGSWPTEQSCKETCMHDCYKCDTFNTAKTISIPCSTPCSEKGRYDTLAEALENCSIEQPEYPFPFFTDVALNKVYRPDIIDTVFQRNYSNQKYGVKSTFTPIVNSTFINKTLFRDNIHMGIRATHDINKRYLEEFSDFPYSNMSNSNIERSLRKDLPPLLDKIKLATGESIKPHILNTIRGLIISDRVDVIDGDELVESLQSILDQQDNYPDTRGTVVTVRGTHASEAKALRLATENSYYLRDDSYGELAKQRLKLWKTLAPDLNKYLPVRGSNGEVTPFYFATDDTIVLDGSGTLTMSDGELVKITVGNGVKEIPVQGDYDRAKIIQIEDLQKIMFILGERYDFKMEVTTDPTLRVDERYGVADARKNFYLLKAEVSGVTDLPRKNAFVAKTEVEYTYMDSVDARRDWVKFKPWPYMVFYVDWADPIISYIINGGTIKITSKDFVFDMFDNEELVQFPRRIPFTVAIIPTNKVGNLTYPSISKQSSYGVREITFNINPDPKKNDTWEPVYLKESRSWPNPGVEVTKKNDFFALDYSMAPKQVKDSLRYQNDNVQPTGERPMFGMRQILKTLKEFKDNWVLRNNRDVMWYDVYDKMDRSKMKFLFTECVNWENQKSLFLMGKISSDDTVNANYPRVRDVKSDGLPITDNFFKTHTVLEQKPLIDQIPEPEPLP
jgi:hypothetical protein